MKNIVADCPVCHTNQSTLFSSDKRRQYFCCHHCDLIFVPREELMSVAEEKVRYDAHENDEADPGYRQYLSQIVNSILPFLKTGSYGLDFGCGKTQLLGSLLSEKSLTMDSFDLFYYPDPAIWKKSYDFIVLSEVIEHLRDPLGEMKRLNSILKPGGHLFIKTKFHPSEKSAFDQWFYKRDLTHVQFFSEISIKFLASELGHEGVSFMEPDLTIISSS